MLWEIARLDRAAGYADCEEDSCQIPLHSRLNGVQGHGATYERVGKM